MLSSLLRVSSYRIEEARWLISRLGFTDIKYILLNEVPKLIVLVYVMTSATGDFLFFFNLIGIFQQTYAKRQGGLHVYLVPNIDPRSKSLLHQP